MGPSESAHIHCAYPNPVPLLLAAPLEVHEMTRKCLDFPALGFPKALLKYFQQPISLRIPVAKQAIHAIYLFVLLRVPHFYFCFWFLWIHAAGLPMLFTRTSTSFWYWIFLVYLSASNTESCDEDDGEVGEGVVEEELADKPGTTSGT